MRPSDNPGRVRREAIAAECAQEVGIEIGVSIEKMVDFIFEAEPAGDLVDELEQHALAERPYASRITLTAEPTELG